MATTVFDKPLDKSVGTLSSLTTTEKGSLVGAINEVKGAIPPVVDNLTSDSTTSALSAAQGKALADQISYIDTDNALSDLDDVPLNAQGRIKLNGTISPTGVGRSFTFESHCDNAARYLEVNDTQTGKTYVATKHGATAQWSAWSCLNDQIDTLNSKMITGEGNPVIPDNSNFNSYKEHGTYTVASDVSASTMTNIPRYSSGRLVVIGRPYQSYVMQIYVPSTANQTIYTRNYNNGTWTSWSELAQYTIGTWTPKLYDYTTYKRDLAEQTYYKIGSLYIMPVYLWNANYTDISTMIQFRNLPCTTLIAGTIFLQNLKSASVGVGIGIGIQPSGNYAYVRANTITSDFIDAVSSGATTMILIGI